MLNSPGADNYVRFTTAELFECGQQQTANLSLRCRHMWAWHYVFMDDRSRKPSSCMRLHEADEDAVSWLIRHFGVLKWEKNMWIYDVVEEKIHGTNDEVFLETKLMATNRDRLRYSSETAPLFQLDWSLHLRWRQECKRYGSQWDRWGLTGSR